MEAGCVLLQMLAAKLRCNAQILKLRRHNEEQKYKAFSAEIIKLIIDGGKTRRDKQRRREIRKCIARFRIRLITESRHALACTVVILDFSSNKEPRNLVSTKHTTHVAIDLIIGSSLSC